MMNDSIEILVVEDEFDSQQVVSKILTHYGMVVHLAQDGVECMQMLETLNPRAIVMDLAMPNMDGWQTLNAIRASTEHASTPVVAITAYDSVGVADDAYKAGFDDYFAKPFEPAVFIQRLHEAISTS